MRGTPGRMRLQLGCSYAAFPALVGTSHCDGHAPIGIPHQAADGTIMETTASAAPRVGAHAFMYRPLRAERSEEHTSELQSLMRISYSVFCLKKKKNTNISVA